MRRHRVCLGIVGLCAALAACNARDWRIQWKPIQWSQINWRWWEQKPAATPTPHSEPIAASQPATWPDETAAAAGSVPRPQTRPAPARHVKRTLAEWRAWWSQYLDAPVVSTVLTVVRTDTGTLAAIELGRGEARRIRVGDEYLIHPIDSEEVLAQVRVYGINETVNEVYTRVVESNNPDRGVQKGDLAVLQAPLR